MGAAHVTCISAAWRKCVLNRNLPIFYVFLGQLLSFSFIASIPVLRIWFDLMVLEVFSSLNDSVIP